LTPPIDDKPDLPVAPPFDGAGRQLTPTGEFRPPPGYLNESGEDDMEKAWRSLLRVMMRLSPRNAAMAFLFFALLAWPSVWKIYSLIDSRLTGIAVEMADLKQEMRDQRLLDQDRWSASQQKIWALELGKSNPSLVVPDPGAILSPLDGFLRAERDSRHNERRRRP
jgi:hypothetical protein